MRAAHAAGAPVVLVADIDRGGAFAHLYGTWALRRRRATARSLRGFVLNKFRGDAVAARARARATSTERTGMAFVGVLPWLEHGLPDEDGAAPRRAAPGAPRVAVVRYPTASNLDEFKLLEQVADVRLGRRRPRDLDGADARRPARARSTSPPTSPGCGRAGSTARSPRAARGERACSASAAGSRCSGERIDDPAGVDGSADGLGLLPVRTVFRARSGRAGRRRSSWRCRALARSSRGLPFAGTRSAMARRRGREPLPSALPDGPRLRGGRRPRGLAARRCSSRPSVVRRLVGQRPEQLARGRFDALADVVEERLDVELLARLAGVA